MRRAFIAAFLLVASQASAQTVTLSITPNPAHVGDLVDLRWEVVSEQIVSFNEPPPEMEHAFAVPLRKPEYVRFPGARVALPRSNVARLVFVPRAAGIYVVPAFRDAPATPLTVEPARETPTGAPEGKFSIGIDATDDSVRPNVVVTISGNVDVANRPPDFDIANHLLTYVLRPGKYGVGIDSNDEPVARQQWFAEFHRADRDDGINDVVFHYWEPARGRDMLVEKPLGKIIPAPSTPHPPKSRWLFFGGIDGALLLALLATKRFCSV